MAVRVTDRFEAIENFGGIAKGERCTVMDYSIVYPCEFSTCVVLTDDGLDIKMWLSDFQKYFKAVDEREEAKVDFNDALEKAVEQQNVHDELDNIAKRLGALELEKQELLKKAGELQFRLCLKE